MNGLTANSRARVELVLEVQIPDNWNEDATVAQIHKQAIDAARQRLVSLTNGGGCRILGEPKVIMILVDTK